MKTRQTKSIVLGIMFLTIVVLFGTGCTKEGVSKGLKGWYTELSEPAKQSDFNEINTAINNHELLKSYHYGGEYHNYYATYDLFISDDGMYSDSSPQCGRLRFSINDMISVIQIVDGSTMKVYYPWLYVEGASSTNGMDAVYKLYSGSVFGNMAYYDTPTYYTYVKSDNKIVVSNGDIYTITDEGLIKDGSSTILSKYDPTKRY